MDLDCEKFAGTIRPDDICLADDVQTENVLSGKIGVRTFLGKSYQYEVETSAGVLKVNMELTMFIKRARRSGCICRRIS